MKAFDTVCSGNSDKAFALIRPPGHHAQRVVYGDRGFCIINTEAVGLAYARHKYGDKRVAIIDTDCHHGDGTQDIFWNDPDTLFISFHQDGRTLYPGTGSAKELGGPGAFGYNINIPLPPNTGDEGFLYVLEHVVMPILDEYKPDLIVNSAGQDNHYTDPLTNMNFSAQGYAALNSRLDPDIAVLEGGYSIQGALPYVNTGIVLAMAGLDYSGVYEPDYDQGLWQQSKHVSSMVRRIAESVYENWRRREKLAARYLSKRDVITRRRNVYYDTAGIMESQVQTFKVCAHCPGVDYVESSNDRGASLLGVTIPRQACSTCQEEGYRLYEDAKGVARRYLQDRPSDQYFADEGAKD